MKLYRVRKGLFGKCILQEWFAPKSLISNTPDPHWVDVSYKDCVTGFVSYTEHLKELHKLELELEGKP
jgi:hypothetical protein